MPTPRPYGVGPYGQGPYERYRGTIYDVAGLASIAWSATAKPVRSVACAGLSSMVWTVSGAVLGRTIDLGAARSALTFDARSLGMQMKIGPRAISSIVFDVDADGVWSWDMTGVAPCWPGSWTETACHPADWTVWQPCAGNAWSSSVSGVGAGVWTPPPAGGTGTWNSARTP
jgi:hypothetical protein